MIEKLIQQRVQEFIRQHAHDDEQQLLLKHRDIFGIPASIIAWQILGRRKSRTKIPLYYNNEKIVYPPGLNLEQCSSEESARFKATILDKELPSKNLLVDLTGGFGVDSFILSKVFNRVLYIEPDTDLMSYAAHNHNILGAANISHTNTTAEQFLKDQFSPADCFFIDPSRRTAGNQKIFKLADCMPNIIQLQAAIFERSDNILIKASPMLDVHQGISDLQDVKYVWVVAVDNEVKELLFLCEKGYAREPVIIALDLKMISESFSFTFGEERSQQPELSNPLSLLYEPSASLLKAGAFKTLATRFSLKKLHPSTHLYTHDQLFESFPGRIFKVEALLKANTGAAQKVFVDGRANVITRNYPLSPDELKKKLRLKDGGELYLIGCSGEKEKFLVAARRLK